MYSYIVEITAKVVEYIPSPIKIRVCLMYHLRKYGYLRRTTLKNKNANDTLQYSYTRTYIITNLELSSFSNKTMVKITTVNSLGDGAPSEVGFDDRKCGVKFGVD